MKLLISIDSVDDEFDIDMKYVNKNINNPYDNYIPHFTESNIDRSVTKKPLKMV